MPGITRRRCGVRRRIPKSGDSGLVQPGMIDGSYATGDGPSAKRLHPAARSAGSVSNTASQSAVHVSWFGAQYVSDSCGVADRSAAFGDVGTRGDPAGQRAVVPLPDRVQDASVWAAVGTGGRGDAPHDAMGHVDECRGDGVERVHDQPACGTTEISVRSG